MKIELEKGFAKALSKKINNFEFQVGVLDDKPHFKPFTQSTLLPQELKSYAGGPARKQSGVAGGLTVGQVLQKNMRRLNTNLLLEPFKDKSSDLIRFMTSFMQMAIARKNPKRVENLLQAVVRNPILRGDYGMNSENTAASKGFNRHLIDTAQMFKAIRAKVRFNAKR